MSDLFTLCVTKILLLSKICRYLCILISYKICLYKIILLSSMKGSHKSGDMKQGLLCVHDRKCPRFKSPKLNCSLAQSPLVKKKYLLIKAGQTMRKFLFQLYGENAYVFLLQFLFKIKD